MLHLVLAPSVLYTGENPVREQVWLRYYEIGHSVFYINHIHSEDIPVQCYDEETEKTCFVLNQGQFISLNLDQGENVGKQPSA